MWTSEPSVDVVAGPAAGEGGQVGWSPESNWPLSSVPAIRQPGLAPPALLAPHLDLR